MKHIIVLALLILAGACNTKSDPSNSETEIKKFGIKSASINYYSKNKKQFSLPVKTANEIYQVIIKSNNKDSKLTISDAKGEPSSNKIVFNFGDRKEIVELWCVASYFSKIDPQIKDFMTNKLYKISADDSKKIASIINEFCRRKVTILEPENKN